MSDYGYDARSQQHFRDQQIAELRTHNPVARQVPTPHQPGTTAFSIGLQLKDRTIITMRIALSKDFPQAPPVIQMLSKCSHPWLSQDGYFCVIGHAGLKHWNSHTSNLGRIVKEIVNEFCTRPPARLTSRANTGSTRAGPPSSATQHSYQPPPTSSTPLGITNHHPGSQSTSSSSSSSSKNNGNSSGGSTSNTNGLMPPSYSSGGKTTDTTPSVAPPKPSKSWTMPDVETTFPEVQSLSASEIQSLMDDDSALNTFCGTVDGVQKFTAVLTALRKKNGDAAEKNLSHEDEITTLKTEINSLHDVLKEKKKAYDALVERQRAILSKSSPTELIRKLQQSADQLELESEELADEFTNDDYENSQKEWQKEFLKQREGYHRRKAMITRYTELSNGGER